MDAIEIELSGRLGLGLNADTEQTLDVFSAICSGVDIDIGLNLAAVEFQYPSFLVGLTTTSAHAIAKHGGRIWISDWPEDDLARLYLRDRGFCGIAGLPEPPESVGFDGHSRQDMLPMRLLDRPALDFDSQIVDLISRMVEFSAGVRYRLEECIAELRANIRQHSETYRPGIIQAQAYMRSHRVRLVVGDLGIGIRSHLARRHSDLLTRPTPEVLEMSLESGVSGTDLTFNSGEGLHELKQFVELNRGELVILSEDGYLRMMDGEKTDSRVLDWRYPGTLVGLTFQADYQRSYSLLSERPEFLRTASKPIGPKGVENR